MISFHDLHAVLVQIFNPHAPRVQVSFSTTRTFSFHFDTFLCRSLQTTYKQIRCPYVDIEFSILTLTINAQFLFRATNSIAA